MHCLHGETKGKNFDDDFSYFTVSRFQTGSTYAIHRATNRALGNLIERPPGIVNSSNFDHSDLADFDSLRVVKHASCKLN